MYIKISNSILTWISYNSGTVPMVLEAKVN